MVKTPLSKWLSFWILKAKLNKHKQYLKYLKHGIFGFMAYSFNWHNIPRDIRLGSYPEEEITLYRGFAPHQFDSERGMFSSALKYNKPTIIDEVIEAVEAGDTSKLIEFISIHADNLDGQTTPFVSAAHEREVAERYARRPGEMVATLSVCADQVVVVPLLPYEVLIVGSIGLNSIVDINEPSLVK